MAQEQQSQGTKLEMFEIRMKPGCGRMLLDRKYRMVDGKLQDNRPRTMDDLADTEEVWLEARKINRDGSVSDGPTAIVPRSAIAAFLDKDGKPSRVVEGYPMQKVKGSDVTEDEHGNPIAPVADTFKPGRVTRLNDNSLNASSLDCTFEIVRKVA